MSGITVCQFKRDNDETINLEKINKIIKDNSPISDLIVFPKNAIKIENIQKVISKKSIVVFSDDKDIIVYDGNNIKTNEVYNDLIFDAKVMRITVDKNHLNPSSYNILLDDIKYDSNLVFTFDGNFILLSKMGVSQENIYDGKCIIFNKDKKYEYDTWIEKRHHISWRFLNNPQNLEYSKTKYGEIYKSLVFYFREMKPDITLSSNLISELALSVSFDGNKTIPKLTERADNLSWMISKLGSYTEYTNAIKNIPDVFNFDDDTIIKIQEWRNSLSDLDISGFGFDGICHPFIDRS